MENLLTVKQKLKLNEKSENGKMEKKLPKDYWIGMQIRCDIKNNKTN